MKEKNMKPTYGTSLLSFIFGWNAEKGLYAIQKTAEYGFDMLEICLPGDLNFDARTVRSQMADNGIQLRCSFNIPKECHIPFHPEQATDTLKRAIDLTAEAGSDFLGGVLHSSIATFSGNPLTEKEKDTLYQVFSILADYAKKSNITLAPEPINRYESYVFTAAEEVLNMIDSLGKDNIGLHLDTFHMNIEENSFYEPVIKAGEKLKHIHMTESDRGMMGEGNVHWDDLFRGLAEINYQGPLVLENFSSEITELVGPTSLWRKSKYNSEDLAKGSLAFMKQMVEKWYK